MTYTQIFDRIPNNQVKEMPDPVTILCWFIRGEKEFFTSSPQHQSDIRYHLSGNWVSSKNHNNLAVGLSDEESTSGPSKSTISVRKELYLFNFVYVL